MDNCVLSWEEIVGYYSYRKLKGNIKRRNTTFFELDSFFTHVKKVAKNSHIDLTIDERSFRSPEEYILSQQDLYLPRLYASGFNGFYVISNVSYYDICQKTLNKMKVLDHNLLETSYRTFCED